MKLVILSFTILLVLKCTEVMCSDSAEEGDSVQKWEPDRQKQVRGQPEGQYGGREDRSHKGIKDLRHNRDDHHHGMEDHRHDTGEHRHGRKEHRHDMRGGRRMKPRRSKHHRQSAEVTPRRELLMLLKNYDNMLRPNWNGEPVNVKVAVFIKSIWKGSNDDVFSGDIYVYQEWNDPQLQLQNMDKINLHGYMVDKIWTPDTYIDNMVGGSIMVLPAPQKLATIMKDGQVQYSYRLLGKYQCNDLHNTSAPLQRIMCPLNFRSYGYGPDDVIYDFVSGKDPIDSSIRIDKKGVSFKHGTSSYTVYSDGGNVVENASNLYFTDFQREQDILQVRIYLEKMKEKEL